MCSKRREKYIFKKTPCILFTAKTPNWITFCKTFYFQNYDYDFFEKKAGLVKSMATYEKKSIIKRIVYSQKKTDP